MVMKLNQQGTTYLELLNEAIDDCTILVDVHCERFEQRISYHASSIKKTVSTRLWSFMESFGLDPQSILVNTSQGKVIDIPMESTTTDVN